MATGMLKFSPNNTVFIDLNLENHTANKAVDIDAEGVEWPLCGGSGQYRIIKGTITNSEAREISLTFRFMDLDYATQAIDSEGTLDLYFPVVGDSVAISGGVFSNVSGDATIDQGFITATGDFTANVESVPN